MLKYLLFILIPTWVFFIQGCTSVRTISSPTGRGARYTYQQSQSPCVQTMRPIYLYSARNLNKLEYVGHSGFFLIHPRMIERLSPSARRLDIFSKVARGGDDPIYIPVGTQMTLRGFKRWSDSFFILIASDDEEVEFIELEFDGRVVMFPYYYSSSGYFLDYDYSDSAGQDTRGVITTCSNFEQMRHLNISLQKKILTGRAKFPWLNKWGKMEKEIEKGK